MRLKLFALSLSFLSIWTPPALSAENEFLLPIHKSVWRVALDGKSTRVPFKFRQAGNGNTQTPLPSPDRRFIAFTRGPNVWMFVPATSECRQITNFPEWGEGGNIQSMAMHGWTENGRLLATLSWVESGPGEGEAPPSTHMTPLDGCKRVVRRNRVDGEIPLNESATYLMTAEPPSFAEEKSPWAYYKRRPVGVIRMGERPPLPPWATSNEYQLYVGLSGKRAVSVDIGAGDKSQIMSIDVPSGKVSPVSLVGGFAEHQWPAMSPDELKVAYKGPGGTLYLDGKELLPINVFQFWWLDDSVIVATSYDGEKGRFRGIIFRVPDKKIVGEFFEPK